MLSKEIINRIVQELDCGLECYVNLETKEIISIPNQRQFGGDIDAEEGFEEQFKQIERQDWFSIKQAEQERIIEQRIQVALEWRNEEEE